MPLDLYNVVFTGELIPGTSTETARRGLQRLFKLDGERLDDLFSGRRIVVKHDADLDTAARFQDAFRAAGARASIEAVETPDSVPATDAAPVGANSEALADDSTATLTLAPPGHVVGDMLQPSDDQIPARALDISALSIVDGDDWSLEDCQPPAPTPRTFDIEHLSLEPLSDPVPNADD